MSRSKRSRMRAAEPTRGFGSKKKNRGKGNRGGKGRAGQGKRNSQQLMKLTKGEKPNLGKFGFKSLNKDAVTINLETLEFALPSLLAKNLIKKNKDTYEVDLKELGYSKLLSKGSVRSKMNITVDAATERAVARIEEAGGKINLPKSEE
ncbi:MAG: uL15 family ribosomal protein [Candidatus Woesearchaeota archaeon]|nr:uL15 family ribosomal protein [Candidatus Woesearchaeota archaeon]